MIDEEILLVDKPAGFSSFQIVRLLKKRKKKVGHAGTLDPFASGLLIIISGKATRRFQYFQGLEKEYVGEMILGMSTDTYDISGKTIGAAKDLAAEEYSGQRLQSLAASLTGAMEQMPPVFSALKQAGQRLYRLSRAGVSVIPKKRQVVVKSFRITDQRFPLLSFRCVVGRGVYIRSLANDYGNLLGCGATLASLRRVRIGEFTIDEARSLGSIIEIGRGL